MTCKVLHFLLPYKTIWWDPRWDNLWCNTVQGSDCRLSPYLALKTKSFLRVREESSCAGGWVTDKQHTHKNVPMEALWGRSRTHARHKQRRWTNSGRRRRRPRRARQTFRAEDLRMLDWWTRTDFKDVLRRATLFCLFPSLICQVIGGRTVRG